MAEIKIKEVDSNIDEMVFDVEVSEDGTHSEHRVTLSREYYERLTKGTILAPRLVEVSFHFLLEREPKESILSDFNLNVINRYFADYEKNIERYF